MAVPAFSLYNRLMDRAAQEPFVTATVGIVTLDAGLFDIIAEMSLL
jgi:hypothetical protein